MNSIHQQDLNGARYPSANVRASGCPVWRAVQCGGRSPLRARRASPACSSLAAPQEAGNQPARLDNTATGSSWHQGQLVSAAPGACPHESFEACEQRLALAVGDEGCAHRRGRQLHQSGLVEAKCGGCKRILLSAQWEWGVGESSGSQARVNCGFAACRGHASPSRRPPVDAASSKP